MQLMHPTFRILSFVLCVSVLAGCVSTSRKIDSLPEDSTKQDVLKALGKSYELYYESEDPNSKITEVWDYRLFPYKGQYDRFLKSLDRTVGIIGSLGAAFFFPPSDTGKETYRLYFKGDRLLKWEEAVAEPTEILPRITPKAAQKEKP